MVLGLCSCTQIKLTSSLNDDTLAEIEGESVSSSEGIFRLMEVIESYGSSDEYFFERSVGDLTMEEYLKDSVEEEMVTLLCCSFIADDLAVYLTDEEIEDAHAQAEDSYNEISLKYDVSAYDISLEDVETLYERQALYEKVYEELTGYVTMEISETDTKVIEVNFVLFPEGTDIETAEAFREEVKNGKDLSEACEEAGYTVYTNITLKKGDMVDAFENVAFALSDGELSECTETVDGIYLIECVEDYLEAESAANYNSVIAEAKDEVFEETYNEFTQTVELKFNTEFWDEIDVTAL